MKHASIHQEGRSLMRRAILLGRLGILFVSMGNPLQVWGQSVFVVDRLSDTGEGSGLRGDLRYCLTQALSGEDRITFEVNGTIDLTGALPDLTASLSIEGPGPDK